MSITYPPIPSNESERLSALARYQILDTPPEDVFDGIVRIAAAVCGTSMALVSLVDKHRRWTKAAVGIAAREVARECSFCAHAIMKPDEVMVVPDTTKDARFTDYPMVLNQPHIRFYAGAPVVTQDGFPLGTVCVVDQQPHELTPAQEAVLQLLASEVMNQLEQRRALTDLASRLETAQRLAQVGDWVYNIASKRHDWSAEIFNILGVPRNAIQPTLISALSCVHPQRPPAGAPL